METKNGQGVKSSYILPIAIMYALFFMISFVTGLQNPCGVIVKNQFSLTGFESQLGNFANFIAYAVMGIPAGLILQKKGYKVTSLVAVTFGLAGVALMLCSTAFDDGAVVYPLYLIGAFVAGFSMCTLNTVVNPMLNTLGGGGKTGNQLIQFGGATNSIGATIVPILVGYLIGEHVEQAQLVQARPALWIALAIFVVAFVVLYLSKLPEPILDEVKKNGVQEKVPMSGAFKYPNFVMGVIAIFMYVGVEVGVANFANLYMTEPLANGGLAISAEIAGTLVGGYWFLMLIGRLIGGAVGGKVSSNAMLSTVSVMFIVLAVLGIFMPTTQVSVLGYQMPLNVLFFILCGLCTSVMWGGIFNIATEGLGKYTGVASGLFMALVCGGGVLPALQGVIADKVGYLNSYWLLIVCVAYILIFALVGKGKKAE